MSGKDSLIQFFRHTLSREPAVWPLVAIVATGMTWGIYCGQNGLRHFPEVVIKRDREWREARGAGYVPPERMPDADPVRRFLSRVSSWGPWAKP
ncbi:hypothetical protein CDCA_CDCA07G2252 [Cyanidium caldarium]|uniref:Uncharacterized protein n=1 Tax=Cyanidium caldarium TaxID=2771 RepID=A0AAV9IVE1_CYACA|nr:hypothetical protein CDCA_CDCA07G2252 [Cyanidium caldarium]|eukprot:ctg_393.g209